MNKCSNIIFFIFVLLSLGVQAQIDANNNRILTDSVVNIQSVSIDTASVDKKKENVFKPNPVKVVWMGAIIPGYGQILNKKYWKLPLVYGGFLGCAYALSMNSTRYQTYKNAYRDIIDTDPNTNSFIQIIPKGYTIESYGGISGYTNILKTGQENYRRYRDLSIIASIGYYALSLVDAYVDAQLYDFDISPDLSMRFQPVLLENPNGLTKTVGMQCCFRLK
ncbi:MAG: hypothetical protein GZ091_12390 [Paludibacter sp.]|nr:hypothetical protein [Paludibacter sp.]